MIKKTKRNKWRNIKRDFMLTHLTRNSIIIFNHMNATDLYNDNSMYVETELSAISKPAKTDLYLQASDLNYFSFFKQTAQMKGLFNFKRRS